MTSDLPKYLGAYSVERRLGSGGMGLVLAGWHRLLGRRVALKVRRRSDEPEEETLAERFRQGGILQSQLDHPHIARVYDYLESSKLQIIVMELLSGRSMEDRIHECGGPLPLPEALEIAIQSSLAVAFAHHRGVIHRDLKPGNLLLVDDSDLSNVRVTDFGVAKTVDRSPDLTLHGTNVGTLWYMPPEQFNNEVPTPKIDVYALGATFYEMFTGQIPYRAAQHSEIFRRFLDREPPPPMRERNPRIPQALADVVETALELDPEDRIPTADALAGLLQAVARQESIGCGAGEASRSASRARLQAAAEAAARLGERVRGGICEALARLHVEQGGSPASFWDASESDEDTTNPNILDSRLATLVSPVHPVSDTLSVTGPASMEGPAVEDDEDRTIVMDHPVSGRQK